MKVILSRKGFDSNTGGTTSPIFENGDMISFPIPENTEEDVSEERFNVLDYKGLDFSELLNQFGYGKEKNQVCHIDPDLVKNRRKTDIKNWMAIFGQCGSAASHLDNKIHVEKGDIFLFFGNFHHVTKRNNGIYERVKKNGDFYKDNDLQVIWGYLQVGDIIRTSDKKEQEKYSWHPHSKALYTENKTNIMYIANDKLTFNADIDGYGILKFRKDRVLTKENCSKANWIKNPVYIGDNITEYSNRKNSSSNKQNTVYYRGQWQELGLKESDECTKWAKKIIED